MMSNSSSRGDPDFSMTRTGDHEGDAGNATWGDVDAGRQGRLAQPADGAPARIKREVEVEEGAVSASTTERVEQDVSSISTQSKDQLIRLCWDLLNNIKSRVYDGNKARERIATLRGQYKKLRREASQVGADNLFILVPLKWWEDKTKDVFERARKSVSGLPKKLQKFAQICQGWDVGRLAKRLKELKKKNLKLHQLASAEGKRGRKLRKEIDNLRTKIDDEKSKLLEFDEVAADDGGSAGISRASKQEVKVEAVSPNTTERVKQEESSIPTRERDQLIKSCWDKITNIRAIVRGWKFAREKITRLRPGRKDKNKDVFKSAMKTMSRLPRKLKVFHQRRQGWSVKTLRKRLHKLSSKRKLLHKLERADVKRAKKLGKRRGKEIDGLKTKIGEEESEHLEFDEVPDDDSRFSHQAPDGYAETIVHCFEAVIPTVIIKGRNDSTLRLPEVVRMWSADSDRLSEQEITLDFDLRVLEEKEIVMWLTGRDLHVAPEKLCAFAKILQALQLWHHLFALCQFISCMEDVSQIASLASCCDDLLDAARDWDAGKNPCINSLSPVSEEVLRRIRKLDWGGLNVIRAFGGRLVHLVNCPLIPPNRPSFLVGLDDSAFIKERRMGLFADLCKELHQTRQFGNVTLTTADGSEESVHLEVLLARSSFFHRMVSSGASEFESLRTAKTIQIERFTGEELAGLVSWIYLNKIPETAGFNILLHLVAHFSVFGELAAMKWVLGMCVSQIGRMSQEELFCCLLENGRAVLNLPEDAQKILVECASEELGKDASVRACLEFSAQLSAKVEEIADRDARIVVFEGKIAELTKDKTELTKEVEEWKAIATKRKREEEGEESEEVEKEGEGSKRVKKRRKLQ